MTKPFSLKQLLTSLTLPFSAGNLHSATKLFTVLTIAAHLKEIDPHERENRMLFSSIRMVNGWPFLRCSIHVVRRQICWIDYQTLFKESVGENIYLHWENVDVSCAKNLLVYSTPSPDQMPGHSATNEPKCSSGVAVGTCNFYWEMARNEKHGIKNARERSNLNMSKSDFHTIY